MKKSLAVVVFMSLCGVVFAEILEPVQEAVVPVEAMMQKGIETFEWGLLAEVEGNYTQTGSQDESDIVLATVEFTAEASLSDWLSGYIGLLWEEDETEDNILDEAYFTVGAEAYIRAGRFYLPFGHFQSAFVSDPVTLELAEINKSSVMAGYTTEGFRIAAGAFKGDHDETVEVFYAAAEVSIGTWFETGVYWLSDLLQTDGLENLNAAIDQKEGGAGVYANLYVGPVTVCAEAISALSEYTIAGGRYAPLAYSLEASVSITPQWTMGAKLEGSDDFYAAYDGLDLSSKFHGRGYGGVVAWDFHENAAASIEYMRLAELDGGVDADRVVLQFAFEID